MANLSFDRPAPITIDRRAKLKGDIFIWFRLDFACQSGINFGGILISGNVLRKLLLKLAFHLEQKLLLLMAL